MSDTDISVVTISLIGPKLPPRYKDSSVTAAMSSPPFTRRYIRVGVNGNWEVLDLDGRLHVHPVTYTELRERIQGIFFSHVNKRPK